MIKFDINRELVKDYAMLMALLATSLFAFLPAVRLLVAKWSGSDDYEHAIFVVPILLYIFWKDRRPLVQNNTFSKIGFIFFVTALVSYLFSLKIQIPSFIFATMIATLISGIFYIGGSQSLKAYTIPILLLIMLIPIPGQLLSMLTGTLQLKISEIGETIIRTLGIPMLREGNVLNIQGMSFQVVEACSGIRSLISLTTLSLLLGYFSLTKFTSRTLLFIISIPIALLINLIRVVTLVLAFYYYKIDLSTGTPHTIIGLILFIFGFALLFTSQRVIEKWEQKRENS